MADLAAASLTAIRLPPASRQEACFTTAVSCAQFSTCQPFAPNMKLSSCSADRGSAIMSLICLQERDKREVLPKSTGRAAPQQSGADTPRLLPVSHEGPQPAIEVDTQQAIHARRPPKPPVPDVSVADNVQLPFVEQDDDFEAFAKSLQRYHSGGQLQ